MMDSPKILSTSPGLDLAVLESPSKAYVGSQKGASPGYETPNPPTPAGLGEPEFSSSFAILNQSPSGERKDSRTFRPFRRVTNFCRSLTRDDARFVACLWSCGTAGWNDACLGTLIPYIEKEFGVRSCESCTAKRTRLTLKSADRLCHCVHALPRHLRRLRHSYLRQPSSHE
jgi:hypothetical protein